MTQFLLPLALLAASAPSLRTVPGRVRPGDAFLVVAKGLGSAPSGSVASRPLQFFPSGRRFVAVGALPIETPAGPLRITVERPGSGGTLEATLEVTTREVEERRLQLEPRFVEPRPPEIQRRFEEDRAALSVAFSQPPSPPLFSGRFAWPRRSRVTAGYGERRTINGVKPSEHYGVDMAGKQGAPVSSSNAGQVVLVRDCWASGQTVVVWHGASLYTTYLHLSKTLVREGDRVRRGQRIGLVGSTGRSSGPHLHWGTRVGDLYVDPRSVLSLRL